ncbi:hypothetical protein GCM10010965_00120 [Caldalkalibacillus thermarum]|uniref:hypothetical protein n=1 Tax=Caldalkalibacillus thermarum TaxID=296745 RepID=UPI0016661102|nr:hypothetical protein [Caldalkalibacillus thermarum]GGK11261.1 hypothetical protein GCM10010965_00120 [Caldalkalibacillus thermarum]
MRQKKEIERRKKRQAEEAWLAQMSDEERLLYRITNLTDNQEDERFKQIRHLRRSDKAEKCGKRRR